METWPNLANHATLLSSGKVLWFRTGVSAYVWDPMSTTHTKRQVGSAIFCAGHGTLADGRVIVVGGSGVDSAWGLPDVNLFDPVSETWSPVADMNFARWYPTSTTLPDGRVLATSGNQSRTPYVVSDIPEVYDPQTDSWSQMAAAELPLPLYPFIFVLPNGKLFFAGSGGAVTETPTSSISRTLGVDAQTWEVVGTPIFSELEGSAAMYRPGKILKVGGGLPAVVGAEVIDMTAPSPAWRQISAMSYPRRKVDLVLLPDGRVLAVGGAVDGDSSPECAVHAAALWEPDTEAWTTMASTERPRAYHATSLLLPDGRVLAAGGENSHDGGEKSAEVYSPPYLFKGPRPTITAVPAIATYNQVFHVDTLDAASIDSVAFLRPGSITHNFDENQRYVPLSFAIAGAGLDVTAPVDANLAPPGDYMLFLVNGNGVPSIAPFIRLVQGAPEIPVLNRWGYALTLGAILGCVRYVMIERRRPPEPA